MQRYRKNISDKDSHKKKTVPSPHGGGTAQSIIHEKTLFRESLYKFINFRYFSFYVSLYFDANVRGKKKSRK
ncbi:hypothetical protein DWZ32_02690 [Bacteroides intestinalis]|jgi:hypothetical protein|uniref:Uncharacterized protein n=1 Tax=Bacteroides intestinalis TaxID=329854 RepID=A0AB37MG73_9BACE|nr:hypothetical protein DWZ32_02690 [Bacteroides intestinalis]